MSVWCIVLVTCVRYIAVCKPEKSQRWLAPNTARKATAIVLFCCAIFTTPHVFDCYVVYNITGRPQKHKAAWAKNKLYYYIYPSVLLNLVLYVVPLSMIIFCTYNMVRSLAAARKRRQEMTSASRDQQDITFSLVIVVALFIFCQLTVPVHRIWVSATGPEQRRCPGASYYYGPVSAVAPVCNSSINFLVFVLCCKRFRNRVVGMLWKGLKVAPVSTTASLSGGKASSAHHTRGRGQPIGSVIPNSAVTTEIHVSQCENQKN